MHHHQQCLCLSLHPLAPEASQQTNAKQFRFADCTRFARELAWLFFNALCVFTFLWGAEAACVQSLAVGDQTHEGAATASIGMLLHCMCVLICLLLFRRFFVFPLGKEARSVCSFAGSLAIGMCVFTPQLLFAAAQMSEALYFVVAKDIVQVAGSGQLFCLLTFARITRSSHLLCFLFSFCSAPASKAAASIGNAPSILVPRVSRPTLCQTPL
jgi:hypothetical protein